jgi:hypothetical protein
MTMPERKMALGPAPRDIDPGDVRVVPFVPLADVPDAVPVDVPPVVPDPPVVVPV